MPQNNQKPFLFSFTAKIILTLIIFAGSAIIIISGAKFIAEYYKTPSNNKIVKQVKQIEQAEQIEQEKNQIETSDLLSKASATENWQTYRNEEYGFEFKYLPEWKIEEHNNCISVKQKISPGFYSSTFSVSIFSNPKKLSALKWAQGYDLGVKVVEPKQKEAIKNSDDIQIYTMIHSEEYFNEHGPSYYTKFFFNPDHSVIFRFSFGQAPNPNAFQMLSTFKFIEKDETEGWQTYQNEEFGFEFKYPKDWSCHDPTFKKINSYTTAILDMTKYGPEQQQQGLSFEDGATLTISFSQYSVGWWPPAIEKLKEEIFNSETTQVFLLNNGFYGRETTSEKEALASKGRVGKEYEATAYLKDKNGFFEIYFHSIEGSSDWKKWGNYEEAFKPILSTFKLID